MQCPHLVKLNLGRCRFITDDSILLLAQNCTNLVSLDVSWTGVTDTSAKQILQRVEKLRHVSFQGCKAVTSEIVPHLCLFLKSLLVDLSWVDDFSCDIIQFIIQRNPNLALLDYYGNMSEGSLFL